MVIEFDLSRALFLTYIGIGAAFLVLGSLVVFTALIGRWGDWRIQRARAREIEAASQADTGNSEKNSVNDSYHLDPQLAAAIGTAVALAVEDYRREQAVEEQNGAQVAQLNGGWREQGRMVAFDSRRIRERDR